jgi:hypothetical protein
MTVVGLTLLCDKHVVELKFNRRTKFVVPPVRRMFCTRDRDFLNSVLSKEIFNFKPPSQPHPYDAASKGLVTVFDILMQDWRNIPASSCEVIMAVPTANQQRFWEFFDKKVKNMTTLQKESFMKNSNGSAYGNKPSGQRFYQTRNEKGQFYKVKA